MSVLYQHLTDAAFHLRNAERSLEAAARAAGPDSSTMRTAAQKAQAFRYMVLREADRQRGGTPA